MPPRAVEIAVGGDSAAWERLGFAPGPDGAFSLGGVRLTVAGKGAMRVAAQGLAAERPDGLALVRGAPEAPPAASAHPNGATGVDHVVAFTDDLDRTITALEAAALELRRIREPPEAPARQAFFRLGEPVLEVVETGRPPVAFWGLVVVVPELPPADLLVGPARDAVQPGRRIATVRGEAGLPVALALMTPRPQPGASS